MATTMVAALTQMLLSIPPLATPMLMVCNAAPFYHGDCHYTYDAKYLGKRHCLCGIALAANHMWRSKTKTRPKRNEQPVENQQRVSAHETLD